MANRSYIIWSILSRTPATGRQRIQCVVSRVSVFIHRRNDYVSSDTHTPSWSPKMTSRLFVFDVKTIS
jgi:hypothetical protein